MYITLNYFLQQVRFILRHTRFFVFLLQHQYPRLGFIQHVSFLPITRRHLFAVLFMLCSILRQYYITLYLFKMRRISISKQYKRLPQYYVTTYTQR